MYSKLKRYLQMPFRLVYVLVISPFFLLKFLYEEKILPKLMAYEKFNLWYRIHHLEIISISHGDILRNSHGSFMALDLEPMLRTDLKGKPIPEDKYLVTEYEYSFRLNSPELLPMLDKRVFNKLELLIFNQGLKIVTLAIKVDGRRKLITYKTKETLIKEAK
jgi:hypothetical protein